MDVVLKIMPIIGLDPCSELPSETPFHVPALARYFPPTNALDLEWHASSAYVNPPYGSGIVSWVSKLHAEVGRGHIGEAIALVPARTDTLWWRVVSKQTVCFIHGRLRFDRPAVAVVGEPEAAEEEEEEGMEPEEVNGKKKADAATFPSALLYWGRSPLRFAYFCEENNFGSCYRPS